MFKHKYFPTFLYLAIIITSLLIIFNLVDIFEKSNKLTGYSTLKPQETPKELEKIKTIFNFKENPQLPEYIYNALILMLFISISTILIKFAYNIQVKNLK